MYDYDELEKIYYKRKIKKYSFYFFILIILSCISYFLYYNSGSNFYKNKKHVKKQVIKSEMNVSKKINTNIVISKQKQKQKQKEKQKKEKQKKEKQNKKIEKLILNPIVPDISIAPVNKSLKKRVERKINKTQKNKIDPKIIIKVSKEKYSLENLLNNYQAFPEYATAIKIANIYFNQKNYNNCIEWAKKANNINAQDAESWLLYAKSLVKLGKINTAKKLLNAYLEIYGQNQKIKKYLRNIK